MKNLDTIVFLLLISTYATAQTNVGGEISANTTWDLSGNPYIVSVDILVDQGVTLTINPGVIVKFDTGRSLLIRGTLRAIGDAADRITFTSSAPDPKPGDWAYIEFDNESTPYDSIAQTGCEMQYCTVEYAGHFNSIYNEVSVVLYNSFPLFQHLIMQDCLGIAMQMTEDKKSGYFLFRYNSIKNDTTSYWLLNFPNQVDHIGEPLYIDFSFDTITNNLGKESGINIFATKVNFTNNLINDNNTISFQINSTNGNILNNLFINNRCSGLGEPDLLGLTIMHLVAKNNLFCRNVYSAGDFGGLMLFAADNSSLVTNNIFAENLDNGIYYINGSSPIVQAGSNFENNSLVYNTVEHNALLSPQLTSDLTNNLIADNNFIPQSDISVILGTQYYFNFHDNNFYRNLNLGFANLYLFESAFSPSDPDIDATDNWWGTADSLVIDSGIYDYFDNPNTGVIKFSPFLKQPDINAPVSPPSDFTKTDLGNGSVRFSWSPNPEGDIAGYRIYWDSLNCYSFAHSINVGKVTSYTLSGGNYNTVYAITAYDNNSISGGLTDQFNGYESWFTYDQTFSPTAINPSPAPNSGIKVYPNPFHSVAIIQFPKQEIGTVSVQLFDLLGRQVWSEEAANPTLLRIGGSAFHPGMYFYKISKDNKIISSGKILAD